MESGETKVRGIMLVKASSDSSKVLEFDANATSGLACQMTFPMPKGMFESLASRHCFAGDYQTSSIKKDGAKAWAFLQSFKDAFWRGEIAVHSLALLNCVNSVTYFDDVEEVYFAGNHGDVGGGWSYAPELTGPVPAYSRRGEKHPDVEARSGGAGLQIILAADYRFWGRDFGKNHLGFPLTDMDANSSREILPIVSYFDLDKHDKWVARAWKPKMGRMRKIPATCAITNLPNHSNTRWKAPKRTFTVMSLKVAGVILEDEMSRSGNVSATWSPFGLFIGGTGTSSYRRIEVVMF
ncbi:uncharacterized protein PAC_18405 [Phialocephala subalpina]|uniref:DUF2235 domain-containing protein n=1 Tax=Phialocephala subalpina TaxID=576137 RepID=A0A1L7XTY9_9HELO|nr:uncharacterized protein PAC_18405 [Phialocephala subalpina]